MDKKRGCHINNNESRTPNVPLAKNSGANVYLITCFCGLKQRIILSRHSRKNCINSYNGCKFYFYLGDLEVMFGELPK